MQEIAVRFFIHVRITEDEWEAARQAIDQSSDQPPRFDGDEDPPNGETIVLVWTGDPEHPTWVEPPLGQPAARCLGSPYSLLHALADYERDWFPGQPINVEWMAREDSSFVRMVSNGEQVIITVDDLQSVRVYVDAEHFGEDLRRSLHTAAMVMQRNAPRLLALPDLSWLSRHLSSDLTTIADATPSQPAEPIPPRDSAADQPPAIDGRIAWRLDPSGWNALSSASDRISPFSVEDAAGTILRAASGWIRFGVDGADWSLVRPSDNSLFTLRPYAPSYGSVYHTETTLLARGYRISLLAFAEFLGSLVSIGLFGHVRADFAEDYLDPVHELSLRFINSEAGAVYIVSDRFADRGTAVHMPAGSFLIAAMAFLESVNAEIRANAPELLDLACLRPIAGFLRTARSSQSQDGAVVEEFDILFRISPDEWSAAQQASWQYASENEGIDFPNWELLPAGTVAIIPRRFTDTTAPDHAPAIVPALGAGAEGYPLDVAVWLAQHVAVLNEIVVDEWNYSRGSGDLQVVCVISPQNVTIRSTSDAAALRIDRAMFERSVRRSLTALTEMILRRAPGLLQVGAFAPLREYAPAGLDLDAPDTLPRDDRPTIAPQLTPVTFPAVRPEPGSPIAWSLTDERWTELIQQGQRIEIGGADDQLGVLYHFADGWIGLAGRLDRVVAADYAANNLQPDHWEALGYKASTLETTRFARGHRVSVLALAEFFGWLLEAADVAHDRTPSTHDYVDPIHPLRMRVVNRDLATISIQTNQFADRGYRLELPVAEFAALADAFRASVAAAVRERAPELRRLVSLRYLLGAGGYPAPSSDRGPSIC